MSKKEKIIPEYKILEMLRDEHGLIRYYEKIKFVLKDYLDLEESYYSIIAIWVIGTYLHKQFPAFPYLFFNAMKGSGKTRALKIISQLSRNGKVAGSMTEAVLFRTAINRTICIDEIEGINAKGNENLRLLLNSAYKRGTTIERISKKKTKDGEEMSIDEFEVFCPIAMANIWGMDSVLGDRCIGLTLEKSQKTEIVKLIENFENEPEFNAIRNGLSKLVAPISTSIFSMLYSQWNSYQKDNVSNVYNISKVSKVSKVNIREKPYITDINDVTDAMFKKIDKSNLLGRDLELFLPLFIIAELCSNDVLGEVLETAKILTKEKKEKDREENRDVQLYEFIAEYQNTGFVGVSELTKEFVDFIGTEEKWINAKWLGRGLRRLKLVKDSRSTGRRREVRIDIEKAKLKLRIFKDIPNNTSEQNKIINKNREVLAENFGEIPEPLLEDISKIKSKQEVTK